MSKYILIITIVAFMSLQTYFFGENDWVSVIFILISTIIMYQVMYKLQISNRKTLRVNAKKDSFLYRFLSSEKTYFTSFIALIVSFILSIGSIIILKGIVREQGQLFTFFGLAIISFVIFTFINHKDTENRIINDNLHEDISNHVNSLVYLFTIAILLNILLSLSLSFHDTEKFLSNDIDIGNFDKISIENKVFKNTNNDTSRLLLNIYVLTDNFKQAIATTILNHYIELEQKDNYFIPFYIIICIFNVLKLFAFSFSFILLQKGFESIVEKILNLYNKSLYKTKKGQL